MVGFANEADVIIGDVHAKALLDTGSTVSTISHQFYTTNFKHLPLQPVQEILNIECADGNQLPYDGFIELDLSILNHEGESNQDTRLQQCLFLVIRDSKYNSTVPVLIGTNILASYIDELESYYGTKYLQDAQLFTPVYLALRCLTLRERKLRKYDNRLAIVKSAETQKILLKPNTETIIRGFLDKEVPYSPTCCLIQPTKNSLIPGDIDITSTVVPYTYGETKAIDVHFTNVSTRTIAVPPCAILCELQPVSIENIERYEEEDIKDTDTLTLEEGVTLCTDGLTLEEIDQGKQLISKYSDLMSKGETDIGTTKLVRHRIELTDNTPFKQKHRRIPPAMYEEVRNHIQQLLACGVIRQSHSPFASNIVLCRKKDGNLRMCVDYRQLNERTIKDAHALPRIEEILEALAGNSYFTVIDMKSGYHNVEIEEEHKERTAFTLGPLGFYEYNKMPFGLANSPATYQRLMETILMDLNLKICFVYLDDVIIFSDTFQEHLQRIDKVFNRLKQAGLKLAPKKCSFFMHRVKYVGHIVSKEGIEPDPDKIEKVKSWPTPKSPEDVRKYLGFVGYYRRFIPNFSKIARPLNSLLPAPQKKRGRQPKESKQKPFTWNEEQDKAFNTLRQCLMEPPVLGYPNFNLPFELHTDASTQGLGAILYQEQDNHKRVIHYASRSLTKSEQHYPAHRLEFLALKWAITEKFSDYLKTKPFTVLTDNNPLTYILTSAKLDATTQRWIAALSSYDFDIKYRSGVNNADADAMSRLPGLLQVTTSLDTISSRSVDAICQAVQPTTVIETISCSTDTVTNIFSEPSLQQLNVPFIQDQDQVLCFWKQQVLAGRKPLKKDIPATPEHRILLNNYDKLHVEDHSLYRTVTDVTSGSTRKQLLIPSGYRKFILQKVHNEMGHQGRDRTISLLRDRFFWYGMTKDVENWITNCDRCIRRKTPTSQRVPMVSIETTQPLELVCMDFLGLETSKGGQQYILVIMDHFTKYAVAVPTKNTTAHTTAEAFMKNFVVHYGFPKTIHTDQGANFEGRLMKELCKMAGVRKSRTTPYHPQGNGSCERFNRTLLNMLGTLNPDQKRDWKAHVSAMVHAYNCTRHDTTGMSPYFLMFGREPHLPIDIIFNLENEEQKLSTNYVQAMKERMQAAYELAIGTSRKQQNIQKSNYDLKARYAALEIGDKVLVKIVSWDGKHKLSDKWEEDVYIVKGQPNLEIPVFVVKKENGTGRQRTVHRNMLLPIESRDPDESIPAIQDTECDQEEDDSLVEYVVDDVDPASVSREDHVITTPTDGGVERPLTRGVEVVPEAGTEVLSDKNDTVDSLEEDINSPPARRSRRQVRQPKWMRSGEFIMSQQSNWRVKADYLKELVMSGMFQSTDDIGRAIVKIVTDSV